jgi:photosystem II stability/assembly factor-like uncharacterized protein
MRLIGRMRHVRTRWFRGVVAVSLVMTLLGCNAAIPPSPAGSASPSTEASVSPSAEGPSPTPDRSPSVTPAASASAQTGGGPGPAIVASTYHGAFAPHGIAFTSTTGGLIVGDSGATDRAVVGTTSDGGRTWKLATLDRPGLLDVATAGGRTWVVMGCAPDGSADCVPTLLRSGDGGATWHALPGAAYVAPSFRDREHGWAIDQSSISTTGRATIVATDDGGLHWRPFAAPCPPGPEAPSRVGLFADGKGWVVCAGDGAAGSQGKAILATVDGGTTWQALSFVGFEGGGIGGLPLAGIIETAGIVPAATGLLGTSHGSLRTTDGGRSWQEIGFGDPESHVIDAISLVDARSGFVLLREFDVARETLLATADGGVTWRRVTGWSFPP